MATLQVDIFCKVIDHLGDIGVCLRLARSLERRTGWRMRIFCDRPDQATRLADSQGDVVPWHPWPDEHAQLESFPEVILCAFGCELPQGIRQQLAARNSDPKRNHSLWMHLDYLSAENWVGDFHGRKSHKVDGLVQLFCFPGFGADSGGLPGDPPIMAPLAAAQPAALHVFAYVYEHAPIQAWLSALAMPLVLRTPAAIAKRCINSSATIEVLATCSQLQWDKTMLGCALLFVRGEDSWVQAMRSGIPWLWQPYPQDPETLSVKHKALLERMAPVLKDHQAWPCWRACLLAWGLGDPPPAALLQLSKHMTSWQIMAEAWASHCNSLPRLDERLCHMVDMHHQQPSAYT